MILTVRVDKLVGTNYPDRSEDLKHFLTNTSIRFDVKLCSMSKKVPPFICTRWTPSLFRKAIRANDMEFVKLLLDLGVSPNVCYPMHGLPLIRALSTSTKMAELLLSYGADPILQNDDGVCKFRN